MATTTPSARAGFHRQHQVLLLGLTALWVGIGVMAYVGVAPIMPELQVPPGLAALVCAAPLLAGLLWARPRVPRRTWATTIDDYWKDARVSANASLVLFLLEGTATLGAVWTLLTGDWLCVLVSALGVLALALHGPARYEQPAAE